MHSRIALILLPSMVGLAGCSGAEGSPLAKQPGALPAPPENGIQIVTSEFGLPAGEEIQNCFYTTLPNESEAFVRRFDAFQSEGGHHLVLFTPIAGRPDGTTEDCTSGDAMVNLLPLIVPVEPDRLVLDDGLAIRLPPHVQVVVQSHYINTSAEPMLVRDVINLEFLSTGVTPIPVGFWSTIYTNLAVPPQRTSTLKYRCVAERELRLLTLVGHMHENGSNLSIDIGPADAPRRVYTVDTWEPSFRDTPPQGRWTMGAPLVIQPGEVMDVTCNYASTSAETLKFPMEMCGSNASFFPADGSIPCAGAFLEGDATN